MVFCIPWYFFITVAAGSSWTYQMIGSRLKLGINMKRAVPIIMAAVVVVAAAAAADSATANPIQADSTPTVRLS